MDSPFARELLHASRGGLKHLIAPIRPFNDRAHRGVNALQGTHRLAACARHIHQANLGVKRSIPHSGAVLRNVSGFAAAVAGVRAATPAGGFVEAVKTARASTAAAFVAVPVGLLGVSAVVTRCTHAHPHAAGRGVGPRIRHRDGALQGAGWGNAEKIKPVRFERNDKKVATLTPQNPQKRCMLTFPPP